jgi:hypothetical protein
MTLLTPTIRRRLPTRQVALRLAGVAAAWVGLFALNEWLWDWSFGALGVDTEARAGGAAHFFLYDSAKILLLLVGMIFAIGLLRTTLNPERVRSFIEGKPLVLALVLAALLGAITPFCTCSSVPIFIGFVAAGIPLSVSLTFLIASPLINEVAVVMLGSTFGWGPTVAYVGTGLGLAIGVGLVLSRFNLKPLVREFVFSAPAAGAFVPGRRPTLGERVTSARRETREIVGKVWIWVLVGVAVGAAIHGWVPESFFVEHASASNPLAVPLATLAGVPLYSNAASAIPIGEALFAKGVPLGTVFAFMMSTAALSFPEAILLNRILKMRLLLTFFAIVAAGIMLIGFAFNAFT